MTEPPTVIGEISAYRTWRVIEIRWEQPRLVSLYSETVWPTDDWLHAECADRDEDEPPEPDPPHAGHHACGIYGARDRPHVHDLGYAAVASINKIFGPAGHTAFGEISLAGKIIPCDKGYRAARARIVRIAVDHMHWQTGRRLARAYRVPLTLTNTQRRHNLV